MSNTQSVKNNLEKKITITKTTEVFQNGVLQSKTVVAGTAIVNYSVNHKIGIVSGDVIVNVDEDLVFSYDPEIPSITLSNSGSLKSIYSAFRSDVYSPLGKSYVRNNGVSTTIVGYPFYAYISSSLAKTSMSSSDSSIMSCANMTCHANKSGFVTLTATIEGAPVMYEDVIEYSSANMPHYYDDDFLPSKKLSWDITVVKSAPTCTGMVIPTSASLCARDNEDLLVSTENALVDSCGEAKCEYTCNTGFIRSGTSCVEIPVCKSIPINSVSCDNAENGLTNSLISKLVDDCNNNKCEFKCAPGFTKVDNACKYIKKGTVTSIEDEQKNSNYIETRP